MVDVKDIISKPLGPQGFLVGLGVAALAYFLAPPLKKALKPVFDKGAEGFTELSNKTKEFISESKNKIKDGMNPYEGQASTEKEPALALEMLKLSKDMEAQREASLQIMRDLKDALSGLKEEMAELKKGMESVAH